MHVWLYLGCFLKKHQLCQIVSWDLRGRDHKLCHRKNLMVMEAAVPEQCWGRLHVLCYMSWTPSVQTEALSPGLGVSESGNATSSRRQTAVTSAYEYLCLRCQQPPDCSATALKCLCVLFLCLYVLTWTHLHSQSDGLCDTCKSGRRLTDFKQDAAKNGGLVTNVFRVKAKQNSKNVFLGTFEAWNRQWSNRNSYLIGTAEFGSLNRVLWGCLWANQSGETLAQLFLNLAGKRSSDITSNRPQMR